MESMGKGAGENAWFPRQKRWNGQTLSIIELRGKLSGRHRVRLCIFLQLTQSRHFKQIYSVLWIENSVWMKIRFRCILFFIFRWGADERTWESSVIIHKRNANCTAHLFKTSVDKLDFFSRETGGLDELGQFLWAMSCNVDVQFVDLLLCKNQITAYIASYIRLNIKCKKAACYPWYLKRYNVWYCPESCDCESPTTRILPDSYLATLRNGDRFACNSGCGQGIMWRAYHWQISDGYDAATKY